MSAELDVMDAFCARSVYLPRCSSLGGFVTEVCGPAGSTQFVLRARGGGGDAGRGLGACFAADLVSGSAVLLLWALGQFLNFFSVCTLGMVVV